MSASIRVPHPERWWVAARTDLPWLTDPDADDGRDRWPDRDERQWTAIARIVEAVGRAVAAGDYHLDHDESSVALVTVDLAGLDAADRNIVVSWFRADSEAPAADPWEDELVNGRHRLWNAWQAAPDALLPIYSALLPYLDDAPVMGSVFAESISESAANGLSELPPAIAARSGRYVAELRRVAREGGYDVDVHAAAAVTGRAAADSTVAGRHAADFARLIGVLHRLTAASGSLVPTVTTRLGGTYPNARARGLLGNRRIDVNGALLTAPEQQQAFWLAHELGHHEDGREHRTAEILGSGTVFLTALAVLQAVVAVAAFVSFFRPGIASLVTVAGFLAIGAGTAVWSAQSRRAEYAADRQAIRLLNSAGYDGQRLAAQELSRPWMSRTRPRYLATHPTGAERLTALGLQHTDEAAGAARSTAGDAAAWP